MERANDGDEIGIVPKGLEKELEELEIRGLIETIQTTAES